MYKTHKNYSEMSWKRKLSSCGKISIMRVCWVIGLIGCSNFLMLTIFMLLVYTRIYIGRNKHYPLVKATRFVRMGRQSDDRRGSLLCVYKTIHESQSSSGMGKSNQEGTVASTVKFKKTVDIKEGWVHDRGSFSDSSSGSSRNIGSGITVVAGWKKRRTRRGRRKNIRLDGFYIIFSASHSRPSHVRV